MNDSWVYIFLLNGSITSVTILLLVYLYYIE